MERGTHRTTWSETALPRFETLRSDTTTEVCIVGGGIAGLTTAYLLARQGVPVLVLEARHIGAGETGHTSAHLSNAIDRRYYRIAKLHGAEAARVVATSHTQAIEQVQAIATAEGVDCALQRVDGWLFAPPGASTDELRRELEAAYAADLGGVQLLDRATATPFDTGACLRFPAQGQIEPLLYLRGLAGAVVRAGGRIADGCRAAEVRGGSDASVRTLHGPTVRCRAVVVATNTPVNDRVAIHTKQAPYRTYVVALRLPRGAVAPALWWDTLDPYHYVRVHSPQATTAPYATDGDVLIVGGEDHKTGQAQDGERRFDRLVAWARERFTMAGDVVHRWSGQVLETVDGLAFIGRNPHDHDNVFVATGDCGMGLTHGTIAGMILSELARGREHPWAKTYSPLRVPWRAATTYLQENLNVALQYADWLGGGDTKEVDAIPRDGAAVLRRGLHKIAVHRDAHGELHAFSATCPHLGCVVAWNPTESSWDCPCHGSRFSTHGEVLNGPANRGLAPVGGSVGTAAAPQPVTAPPSQEGGTQASP